MQCKNTKGRGERERGGGGPGLPWPGDSAPLARSPAPLLLAPVEEAAALPACLEDDDDDLLDDLPYPLVSAQAVSPKVLCLPRGVWIQKRLALGKLSSAPESQFARYLEMSKRDEEPQQEPRRRETYFTLRRLGKGERGRAEETSQDLVVDPVVTA